MRRALLIWPVLALVTASSAPAARAESESAQRPVTAVTASQRFRFDAGARLLAPAGVAPDGRVCVGTIDGYIHALAPDGSYRWSHTVHGSITRRPVFTGERWLLVGGTDRLYALQPDNGVLSWVFKSLSAVQSELTVARDGTSYFSAADGFFYGLSTRGGISLRVPFGRLTAGPWLATDGAIWAENSEGARLRVRGLEVRRFKAGEASEVTFPDPELLRDPEGREWRGLDDGRIQLGEQALPIAGSPLFAPVWSSATHAAIVSTRSGLVFALEPVFVRRSR